MKHSARSLYFSACNATLFSFKLTPIAPTPYRLRCTGGRGRAIECRIPMLSRRSRTCGIGWTRACGRTLHPILRLAGKCVYFCGCVSFRSQLHVLLASAIIWLTARACCQSHVSSARGDGRDLSFECPRGAGIWCIRRCARERWCIWRAFNTEPPARAS